MRIARNEIGRKFGALILLSFISMSCGSTDDDDLPDALVNTWKGATCAKIPDGSYANTTVVFTSATFTLEQQTYSAIDCSESSKSVRSVTTGTWTKGSSVSGISGAYNLDQTFTKVQIALNTDIAVSSLNTSGKEVCGGGWVKDTLKELKADAANCDDFLKAGDIFYDIYKIDGSALYFGDTSGKKTDGTVLDGLSSVNRPTALDDVKYTKQ